VPSANSQAAHLHRFSIRVVVRALWPKDPDTVAVPSGVTRSALAPPYVADEIAPRRVHRRRYRNSTRTVRSFARAVRVARRHEPSFARPQYFVRRSEIRVVVQFQIALWTSGPRVVGCQWSDTRAQSDSDVHPRARDKSWSVGICDRCREFEAPQLSR